MSGISESVIEDVALDRLKSLGRSITHDPDIAPGTLGADPEKQGWSAILEGGARPAGKASAYKIPHHGAGNADLPAVWDQMLENGPVAVLTPWRRGSRALPTTQDVERISKATPHARITNKGPSGKSNVGHEDRTVEKNIA